MCNSKSYFPMDALFQTLVEDGIAKIKGYRVDELVDTLNVPFDNFTDIDNLSKSLNNWFVSFILRCPEFQQHKVIGHYEYNSVHYFPLFVIEIIPSKSDRYEQATMCVSVYYCADLNCLGIMYIPLEPLTKVTSSNCNTVKDIYDYLCKQTDITKMPFL